MRFSRSLEKNSLLISLLAGNLEKNQSPPQTFCDRFGAARDCQLSQNRADVKFGGVLRDAQARGNLFIAEAARQQAQHLDLAPRQLLNRFSGLSKPMRQLLRDVACDFLIKYHQA